jgi:transposase-like protein
VQQLIEAEVSEMIGAERGERAPEERLTHRNGYRAAAVSANLTRTCGCRKLRLPADRSIRAEWSGLAVHMAESVKSRSVALFEDEVWRRC